ncbi:acyl-CoA reductase [Fulvivirga sedimenti]|uniref:Acyl-CoA reductase n=1 Tax=Fulvivirga sedimenti TaxID=2879465 RepID=A0A9X1KWN6_9BACT|nr:acyl-CoA reductase [Fulvivirga sedimenti]MCA6074945.1 acyl-CoA reductase [Fulvivirga sedimenti]MCA6076122.1 acyl-CoA reductase [Fulvivirga sedimenti]MCA6077250.1 acyl-CoA reductase [Fulvivirga sedimenti]
MGINIFQKEFIQAISNLQHKLKDLSEEEMDTLALRASNENPWFTRENVEFAFTGITSMLNEPSLTQWLSGYDTVSKPSRIGLILAGNIPLVGFHDLLCVLASGNYAVVKMSSKDNVLMQFMIGQISEVSPKIGERIILQERLNDVDAIIATGSDNSARYFEYYFGKYPNIIRKNRTSVAVLTGSEDAEDFKRLGSDIFTYFGLGCRNVSKLYVPEKFDFTPFFEGIQQYANVIHQHKYNNNYDFNKSVLLVNGEPHLDNGFLLLQSTSQLVSPVGVLFFETYATPRELEEMLGQQRDKIQCIVEAEKTRLITGAVPFGKAQLPELWDYADNVDTMEFLMSL